jgi:GntR family transcriptional regulator, vanillate catabolism transcriptional regulator
MNKQFQDLIIQGAGSKVIFEAIERNGRIPFAAARAIAFDKVDLPGMYASLSYAHRQHHAIVNALEFGEAERVAALMYEHAYGTKASINMNRKTWRVGTDEGDTSTAKQEPMNILQS